MKNKNGVMGQVISIFVMIMIISVLAGLTFLFIMSLKENVADQTRVLHAVTNETLTTVTETGEYVAMYTQPLFRIDQTNASVIIINASGPSVLEEDNYTIGLGGLISLYGDNPNWNNTDLNISYKFTSVSPIGAYAATNTTEAAGFQTVKYLSLLFLALIFGAILTVILRVILPYVNLGARASEF